jgi:hypothetical protein
MPTLAIDKLRRDGGTQPRAAISEAVIADYAEAMQGGADFPPVVVFYDGTDHWLADGFHRAEASLRSGRSQVEADIRQGTRRDAILFSVGANAEHGQRRTNADKRRAVETLLRDEEWSRWADREIARRAAVTTPFVSKVRAELSVNRLQIAEPAAAARAPVGEVRNVSRGGKTYAMKTERIGKAKSAAAEPRLDSPAAVAPPRAATPKPAPSRAATPKPERDAVEVGSPRDRWERAWHAVMALSMPDQRRLCVKVLAQIDGTRQRAGAAS